MGSLSDMPYEHALKQFLKPTLHELDMYTTDAQNLLHVSAVYGCHPQENITVFKVMLSK